MLMNDGKLRHKTAKVLKHLHGDAWCGSEEIGNVKRKSIALPSKHSCSGFFRNIGYIRNIAAYYPTAQSRVRSPIQPHKVKSGAFA